MATWLAVDELDFNGAWAVADGWLARARRLLEPLEPGPDHGWLAFHEGYLAHSRGEADRARALAAEVAELGRRLGVADLEMLGLALEGASLLAVAEIEDGMRCLDEATVADRIEGGPREYVDFYKATFGPIVGLFALLAGEPERAAALDRDLLDFATRANRGEAAGPSEYAYEILVVVARRREERPPTDS